MQKVLWIVAILAAQLFVDSASAKVVNVELLNKKLQQQNANWFAKDNWLNHLSKEELRHVFGLRDTPTADVQFVSPQSLESKAAIPGSRDWRDYQGKNWVSPIANQGNCGSCVAFAAVGVLETQINISALIPDLNVKLSPQYLFGCGGGMCDYGWYPGSAASYLQSKGVPDEACLPYTSGASGQDVSCQAACSNAPSRVKKISSYKSPSKTVRNIAAVKQALLQGPVMTTLTVYSDFMTYSSGVYKRTSDEALGGHAISIVGYDDITRSWIIRNSWGEDWGEKGFGHVSYDDDSGVADSTWQFVVPAAGGYASTVYPKDYTYLNGVTQFSGSSTFAATAGLKFNIFDKSSKQVLNIACESAPCSAAIDTTKLADGRYEVETAAVDATGKVLGSSVREFFYIVNNEPKLTLSFKGHSGLDLSKPLKDRVEFEAASTAAPVPMSSLEFHIKNLATGETKVRLSEVVLDKMVLGWRTNLVANGEYELWMVGKLKAGNKESKVETARIKVKTQN